MFRCKFHHKERKMDMVRRRRWHRKMVCESASSPCFFHIHSEGGKCDSDSEDEDDKYKAALTAPRMFLTCHSKYKAALTAPRMFLTCHSK